MLFQKPCYLALLLVALSIASVLTESGSSSEGSENRKKQIVHCNYTLHGPELCASCKDVLLCTPSNIGILIRCSGSRKSCNNGRCSETPTANCNSTSNAGSGRFGIGLSFHWG